jgi:L-histidine N-alpha-methyltransferase
VRIDEATHRTEFRLTISDLLPQTGDGRVVREILAGLAASRKWISSKYFYDATGSKLFEEITRLPEYYLTRLEMGLLDEAAAFLGRSLEGVEIVELGSGDCSKISILLDAVPNDHLSSISYRPFDISRSALDKSARTLIERFPGISVHCMIGDFLQQLHLIPSGKRRLFCFLGSTVGNLSSAQSDRFFRGLGELMKTGERLLLGVDMVKDRAAVERAYNDSRGVTARFNRNILNVVNNLAKTDFNPDVFAHIAFYNEGENRIEMHLKAREDCSVSSPHVTKPIFIEKDETIHTENSRKFTVDHVRGWAESIGAEITWIFTDRRRWFSLFLLTRR